MFTPKPTLTSMSDPSATPQCPLATSIPLAQLRQKAGRGQNLVIIVAAGLIILVGVGYRALKRLRKSAGK